MGNIVDYAESELQTWERRPFNSVDSLILSQLAYARFEGAVSPLAEQGEWLPIRKLYKAELFPRLFGSARAPALNRRLLTALAASPRFRELHVNYYETRLDPEKEEQFAAVSFLLPDHTVYAAFRGTDSSLTGWKEDFNMAFISPVPAQLAAERYLNVVAERSPGPLLAGGHSKGGNLAVYAAMRGKPEHQARIRKIYSHDGPGFKEGVLESAGFRAVRERVEKTLPQCSLVGMLLQQQEPYRVLESDRFWLLQHDPFSWKVENGDFLYLPELNAEAQYFNRTINQWIEGLSPEERERFADALFRILSSDDAGGFSPFSANWLSHSLNMAAALKNIDPETRRFLGRIALGLAVIYVQNGEAELKNARLRGLPPLSGRRPGRIGENPAL